MGRKARASKVELISRRLSSLEALPDEALPTLDFRSAPEEFTFSLCSCSAKRLLKNPTTIIRRSPRIQSSVQELAPVIEEIIVSESEKDGEPILNEENKFTEEASEETSSPKKANPGVADVKYKAMYISSQTKIKALLEENMQLSKSLELANGKINVYEKLILSYTKVMGIIGSLAKVNEDLAARVKLGAPTAGDEVRRSKKRKNLREGAH